MTEHAEHTLELPDDGATATAPSGFVVGATIGHFRLTRELGAGGMGLVFEAYDPDLDRRVAIKVLRERQAHRLIAEAQAMARLAHPNVVAVHEVGTIDDQLFVVMELVVGETLGSWLAEDRTWRDIVAMFVQAGDGLVAAHEAGLVHRDFKPTNVLVDTAGRARVVDFGIARSDDAPAPPPRLAGGSQPAGTPGYMAPEQIAGGTVDARADQYAFAVALDQALAGRGGARRVRRAIARARSVDPADRYPILRDLLDELRGSLRTQRRAVIAALGLACASAAGAALVAVSSAAAPLGDECTDGVGLVDQVWTPAARATIADNPAALRAVDDWVESWRLARHSACAATETSGAVPGPEATVSGPEASAWRSSRAARLACLDGRLAELRAQAAVWEGGDRAVLSRALPAAAALTSPESCATAVPIAAALTPLDARAATLDVLRRAGKNAEAHALAPRLLADAQAAGDPATLARVLISVAYIEREVAEYRAATDHFAAAAREATRAGDEGRVLEAMIMQASVASDRGTPVEAIGILDAASAFAGKTASPAVVAQLALARSDAYTIAGRLPEGVEQARRAVDILEPLAHRDPRVRLRLASALGSLAAAEGLSFHFDVAKALLLRCLAIEEADYSGDHPEIAKTLHDLANMEGRLNQFADAKRHYERARAILAAQYGERHHDVALTDYSLGNLELEQGNLDKARVYYDRSLAGLDPTHPDVARIEGALGYIGRATDQCTDAIPHIERARAMLEHHHRGGTELAIQLVNLGACLGEVGRDAEARPVLERALAEYVRAKVSEIDRTEANALLAEIEWRAGNRAKARALASSVITTIGDADEPYATLRREMARELATWK